LPTHVGWLKNKDRYVLAWGYDGDPTHKDFGKLTRAFDLDQLQFVSEADFKPADYQGHLHELGAWSVTPKPGAEQQLLVHQKGKEKPVVAHKQTKMGGFTLIPRAGQDPVLAAAWTSQIVLHNVNNGDHFGVSAEVNRATDMAPSPDGKFLAVPRGKSITLYAISDKALNPLLYVYCTEQDWIVNANSGYYAASPGGEKLMGWAASPNVTTPATFHPASRFRKQFYRPDVITQILKRGISLKEALKIANDDLKAQGKAVPGEVALENLLGPTGYIDRVEDAKRPTITVHVKAAAARANDPITKLELLADGRPLFGKDGVKELAKPQETAEASFAVELPPGSYKLTVRISSKKTSAISAEAHASYSPAVAPKAKLHVLAVGASQYKHHEGLNLPSPAKDATKIAEILPKQCGLPLFAPGGSSEAFVGPKATSANVYQAVANLSKQVKPEDVAVIYFGGHGMKAPGGGLYLLTYDADMNNLDKTALSGKKLRDDLAKVECRGVILILDACHSGAIGPKANPVVDDLTRELTDDDCGVIVWCSAMGYEKAQIDQDSGHGLFTLKLLEALDPKKGARPSIYDGKVYLHSIQAFVYEAVLHHSGQRQHPSLNIPWTVEAFALRSK
jgi:hypothetical protein